MLLYIVGFILSVVILSVCFYFLFDKYTYGNLVTIGLLSLGSWFSVLCEIILALVVLFQWIIDDMPKSKFWNKEIFKKK